MPVTSAVTAPYSGTSNQTQIAKTHSIPDTDPSMLSNTGAEYRPSHYTPRRHSTNSVSFPLSLSFSLIPYPISLWFPRSWPLS